jgi:hypothetical protein
MQYVSCHGKIVDYGVPRTKSANRSIPGLARQTFQLEEASMTSVQIAAVFVLALAVVGSRTTAEEPKKDGEKKGTVTGVVTAKGENWIEVKADGEEKARRYVPHWRGGNPKDGGGLDKEMVAKIKEVPVKARVRLEWTFEERPRVEKIEVLRKDKE